MAKAKLAARVQSAKCENVKMLNGQLQGPAEGRHPHGKLSSLSCPVFPPRGNAALKIMFGPLRPQTSDLKKITTKTTVCIYIHGIYKSHLERTPKKRDGDGGLKAGHAKCGHYESRALPSAEHADVLANW